MPTDELDRQFRKGYGEHATLYDNRRFSGNATREQYTQLENGLIDDLIQPQPGMVILDVGTGTGRASIALARNAGTQVIGLDLTMEMLQQAASKRDAAGLDSPALVCGNARALPFPNDTFDVVLAIRVLHIFPHVHWGAFIDEMVRVLKPGGTLVVEFDSPLAGGVWAIIRETVWRLRGSRQRYYLWPHNIDPLFNGMLKRQVHGFWLPGAVRLAGLHSTLRHLTRLARLSPPFGFLGNKVLIRAQKRVR